MLALDRRTFVRSAGAVTVLGLAAGRLSGDAAAQAAPAKGPFTLPPLPYDPAALEPHIDATTMGLHHGKHHAAYVNNLNAAIADKPEIASLPLEDLLAKLKDVPDSVRAAVRNNAGGHANHSMFWQIMGKPGGPGPEGDLKTAVDRDFSSLATLQEQFNSMGGKVFGSGWVFVTVDKGGKLALEARPNQDTPLMDGKRVLMGNDVWEHAYYLKYQNKRADYLKAWWNVVNWKSVGDRYAAATAGKLAI
jgi:Fe-Mn family superoxide dismutase